MHTRTHAHLLRKLLLDHKDKRRDLRLERGRSWQQRHIGPGRQSHIGLGRRRHIGPGRRRHITSDGDCADGHFRRNALRRNACDDPMDFGVERIEVLQTKQQAKTNKQNNKKNNKQNNKKNNKQPHKLSIVKRRRSGSFGSFASAQTTARSAQRAVHGRLRTSAAGLTGPTSPTSAPGLDSTRPHRHRD
jgi:hypothetical protein